jgi:hypothetical protein
MAGIFKITDLKKERYNKSLVDLEDIYEKYSVKKKIKAQLQVQNLQYIHEKLVFIKCVCGQLI